MSNLLDSFYRLSTRVAESGILMMDSTLRIMQTAVERLTDQDNSSVGLHAPVKGPETMNDATSDFANRLARIAWMTGLPETGHYSSRSASGTKSSRSGWTRFTAWFIQTLQWIFLLILRPTKSSFKKNSRLRQKALTGFLPIVTSRLLAKMKM
jgi:hypothetical protein